MTNQNIKPDYLRVSEILAPFTGIEFVPEEPLRKAAERGTMVHAYIEAYLRGHQWEVVPAEIQGYWEAFKSAESEINFMDGTNEIERRLYCDELMITGQIDLINKIPPGCITLFDWKTSYKPSASWILQANAYLYLASVNKIPAGGAFFIHLHKDGTFDRWNYNFDPYIHEIFLDCLKLYKYFEMHKTRKKKEYLNDE